MLRKGLFAGLALLATFVLAHTEEPATEVNSDVISLVQDTFHGIVDPEKLILVEFFAPWCGHCKALAPEYEKAATELKEKDIKLAKVDCTAETELCNKFEVKGYPTLKVFRNGNATDYTGGRKTDLIVSYMKKQAQAAISDVTVETLDTFKDSDNVVVIGFFSENDQNEFNIFSDLGEEWRNTDFIFGVTGQKEAADKAGVETPAVILYKKFDEGKNVHEGTFTKDQLATFIRSNSVPVLAEITPENYAAYVDTGLPIAFLFYEDEEQKKTLGKAIEPVASEHKGKVNFVYIDATKYGTHAQNINLKQEWPAFGIQKPEDELKYPFDQTKEITTESIREFVNKFAKGEIQPSVKSEPIPEKNDDPVYVLVADTFEEAVYDPKKDVLVEFYAPWCGHCKKLAPIYDKLGEAYSAFKDKVLIAKIDATANDLPSRVPFKISGFPTIKLFKAGDKEIEDYNGDRSFESFIEFLDKNTVNKVEANVTSPAAESEEAVPSAASSSVAPEVSETVAVREDL